MLELTRQPDYILGEGGTDFMVVAKIKLGKSVDSICMAIHILQLIYGHNAGTIWLYIAYRAI